MEHSLFYQEWALMNPKYENDNSIISIIIKMHTDSNMLLLYTLKYMLYTMKNSFDNYKTNSYYYCICVYNKCNICIYKICNMYIIN